MSVRSEKWEHPGAGHGPRVLIVTWEAGDLYPHAAAFSTREKAAAFATTVDGSIIDSFVDVHCVTEGQSNG